MQPSAIQGVVEISYLNFDPAQECNAPKMCFKVAQGSSNQM